MFDKEIVISSLQDILSTCRLIEDRAAGVTCGDDFATSPTGMLKLDAICMNLIAIGEAVKGLDKVTQGTLLTRYPEVYWKGVMKMRDKIAHHYFEVDADVVYSTIKDDLPGLKKTICMMLENIKRGNP